MVKLNKEEFNEKIFTRINNLINEYNLIKESMGLIPLFKMQRI